MKVYAFTMKHDNGTVELRIADTTLESARRRILDIERAPESAIQGWRIVPTARQVARTKSLMRGL